MKTRILTAVLALSTVVAFAQKRDIRRAGKAVDKAEYQEALNHLNEAKPKLADADQDEKADYYLYRGYALIGNGENVPTNDLMEATEAFKKAQELGHEEAQQGLTTASNALVNAAIADQNAQDFSAAADKLYTGYQLNEQDTLYLYYAASNAVNAQEYSRALEYYEELQDLGFTGIETQYVATNKETGEEELMGSKEQRDLFIKSGNYENPQTRVTESKKGEIAKNIALIYIQQGETDKAIAAIDRALEDNPNDPALMQAQADVYYNMGDMAKYREIMEKIAEQNPNDAVLFYNLGVSSAELGEKDRAIEYYNRAIELDPEMSNARINMAYIILSEEAPLVEQMNTLGMSKADQKKYDELAEKRQEIYRKALPHLEKVIANDPNNIEAFRTLMNIHYQLGNTDKAEEIKAKIAELETQGAGQ